MTSMAVTSPKRVVFVDALRVFAAIQMVQGHTIDALLAPAYRSGVGFEAWTFIRGLTSVTFLFAAGLSYVLATSQSRDPQAGTRRRLRRGVQLIVIGYLMHAPVAILFGSDAHATWQEALSVDVLQCIGVSLLMLEAIQHVFAGQGQRMFAALTISVALLALAVPCARLVPHGSTFALTSYLSVRGGSLFPLVPFSGIVLFGMVAGLIAFGDGGPWAASRLGLLGFMTILGALLGSVLPVDARVAPGQLLLKLGLVVLFSAFLALVFRRVRRLWGWLSLIARETLFLYVSHVWLLYAAHVGVRARFGSTLSPGQALVVAVILFVLCMAGALGYRRAERALRARMGGGR
jgi:hypothetical protein